MAEALVSLHGVSLGYPGRPVLDDVTLTVEQGDFLVLVGPNGAGKTTLLRGLAGLLPPRSGHVIRRADVAIGYVPQERELDPIFPLSALDVVMQGRIARLGPGGRPAPRDRDVVRRSMAETDAGALASAPFRTLSGGQKQRVLLARALAAEPTLMVLDEPTSGTDPASESGLMAVLRSLRVERGLTVVLATHDLTLAANHATRVALVDRARRLFRVGAEAEILRDDVLTRLYGCDVRVRQVEGWRAVLVGNL